jgi:hypothetical protein
MIERSTMSSGFGFFCTPATIGPIDGDEMKKDNKRTAAASLFGAVITFLRAI